MSHPNPVVAASDGAALPLLDPRAFGEVNAGAAAFAGDGAALLSKGYLEKLDPESREGLTTS